LRKLGALSIRRDTNKLRFHPSGSEGCSAAAMLALLRKLSAFVRQELEAEAGSKAKELLRRYGSPRVYFGQRYSKSQD